MPLMLKSLFSPPRAGLLLWVCAGLPLAAAAAPAPLPQPLLVPSYGYWIDDADCVEEAPAVRPPPSVLAMMAPQSAALPVPVAMTPAPPPPAPPPPAPPPPAWQLKAADQTLRTALARWASSEGWQLVWEAPVDYAVERDTSVGGSFEQAIEAVAHSMAGAETPLQAIFYKSNRVIRIVAKGAQS